MAAVSRASRPAAFSIRAAALTAAIVGASIEGRTPLLQPPALYDSGGTGATSVAAGDLNGDGKPDLVVANSSSGTVGVLLNSGVGSFRPVRLYEGGGRFPHAVAVADVNGDGLGDVLVGSRCVDAGDCHGLVGVLLGNGDGTLRPSIVHESGGEVAWSVAAADVNGDGRPDLLVVNEASNTVGVLLGLGDAAFDIPRVYDSGGRSPRSVAVGDVNGDAVPDLAVANRCSSFAPGCSQTGDVGVLLGNGDGSFRPAVRYPTGGDGPIGLVLSDVNRDNDPDLLVANACSETVNCSVGSASVLLNQGDGTFGSAVSYKGSGLGGRSVAVADLDRDDNPDLALASLCANGCTEGTIDVLFGAGDGTFRPDAAHGTGAFGAVSVAGTDVDGDAVADVIVANEGCAGADCVNSTVSVLLNSAGYIAVGIDIQPGRFPNRLNPHGHAVVQVGLLSSEVLDATTVDASTVHFGPGGGSPVGARTRDLDADGRLDAVFFFHVDMSGIACGDAAATLVGATPEGHRFRGTDSVETLGCPR